MPVNDCLGNAALLAAAINDVSSGAWESNKVLQNFESCMQKMKEDHAAEISRLKTQIEMGKRSLLQAEAQLEQFEVAMEESQRYHRQLLDLVKQARYGGVIRFLNAFPVAPHGDCQELNASLLQ